MGSRLPDTRAMVLLAEFHESMLSHQGSAAVRMPVAEAQQCAGLTRIPSSGDPTEASDAWMDAYRRSAPAGEQSQAAVHARRPLADISQACP